MANDLQAGTRPPVDVEQWLDFIIAAAAHRSHDEGQREFGRMLLERYFIALRDDYKDDPSAAGYLDNILCAVASAIRGFSVVRDVFQTNWDALKEEKDREKARAERIDAFSPFRKDGYWKQTLAAAATLGLIAPLLAAFQSAIGRMPAVMTLIIALICIAGLFGMELFVQWLRDKRLAEISTRFPDELMEKWRAQSLRGYRTVLRQFLILAIRIREQHYPLLSTLDGHRVQSQQIPHIDVELTSDAVLTDDLPALEAKLSAVVEQHFAFKLKDSTPTG